MSEPRPIVFRARRVDTGEWVYGIMDIANTISPENIPEGRVISLPEFFSLIVAYALDVDTLGEWTGRRDSTGRMVFGGDKIDDEETTVIVDWDNEYGCWRVCSADQTERGAITDCDLATFLEDPECSRVVGTIHDEKGDA